MLPVTANDFRFFEIKRRAYCEGWLRLFVFVLSRDYLFFIVSDVLNPVAELVNEALNLLLSNVAIGESGSFDVI